MLGCAEISCFEGGSANQKLGLTHQSWEARVSSGGHFTWIVNTAYIGLLKKMPLT